MPGFIYVFYQSMPVRLLTSVITAVFVFTVIETLFCIALAIRFDIREITGYRVCFYGHYNMTAPRNSVTLRESGGNWLQWLRVLSGDFRVRYEPLEKHKPVKRLAWSLVNALRFTTMFFLTPFFLVFSFTGVFERVFRYFLGFPGFILFWLLANLKVIVSYHLNRYTIDLNGGDIAPSCNLDVLYGKPTINIMLHRPGDRSDSAQKDTINQFTASLEGILPPRKIARIKTVVNYPDGKKGLETDLPLTDRHLQRTFKNLIIS